MSLEVIYSIGFGLSILGNICSMFYCSQLKRSAARERGIMVADINALHKFHKDAEERADKAEKELARQPEKPLSVEASQILHDLTRTGNAVVRIVPLDPKDIFYRAPRGL